MVSFGPPDEELETRHDAVTSVDASMIAASVPGTSLGEVLDVAGRTYAMEGFPAEWERHHQGGLTGYAGREVFGTPGEPYRLRAYQAVAWNPSITRVKSEDTVLITPSGFDVLTASGTWPTRDLRAGSIAVPRPAMLVPGLPGTQPHGDA